MKPEWSQLLSVLVHQTGKTLNLNDLARRWQLSPEEHKQLHRMARILAEAGGARLLRGNKIQWEHSSVVAGLVHVRRDGKANLRDFDDPSERLATLGQRGLGEAVQGDLVLAHLRRRGPRVEGRVLSVLERSSQPVVGILSAAQGGCLLPEDGRFPPIRLDQPWSPSLQEGALAAVKMKQPDKKNTALSGTLLEIFGQADSPEAELKRLVFKYDLPWHFPQDVIDAADNISESIDDSENRQDLRQLPFVTIDGETAQDFDDAVCLKKEGGAFRLWVAIADVSYYVKPNSELDREAKERGTSVYFPGLCIPMLPERLSNDLCSLRPGEDRLTLCAELQLTSNGALESTNVYPAIIHSHARLTYTEASAYLEGGAAQTNAPHLAQLNPMAELADILYRQRIARGGLDFDLPEPEIVLDLQGRPEDLVLSIRTQAHRIIEECMLVANRAVAEFLTQQGRPYLSRVHDQPPADKLLEFQQTLSSYNQGINLAHSQGIHGALAEFLGQIEGLPTAPALHRLLLRTMAQAVYSPEARGHFGLALDYYCHFTSPIRRYPDLLVHRALKRLLAKKPDSGKGLNEEGTQASARERRAMEAERESVQLKKCQFMMERIGEPFRGTIHYVASFGFFVELEELPVEGLVPLTSLTDDYYVYDPDAQSLVGERRRQQFQLGDKVAIIVDGVDLVRREITFQVKDMLPTSSDMRQGRKSRSRHRGSRRKRR